MDYLVHIDNNEHGIVHLVFIGVASQIFIGWLVGFVALHPKSKAMVIAGRPVHLTTLFPGQA